MGRWSVPLRTAVTALASLALVGFSAVGMATASAQGLPPLVLGDQDGSPTYTENFNPLSVNALEGWWFMYEPLYVIDSLTGAQHPWLATSYKWVNPKTLTFTIRKGVTWNNGAPFTPQDVVFTFDLLKKYPAVDLNGIWKVLSGVSASGDTVTFTFKTVDIPAFQYIATQAIVYPPQFAYVNPVTFTDPNPIATGPFMVKQFTPQEYTLKPNPRYWQRSLVKVPEIEEVALSSNTTSDLLLSEGKFDEAVLFEPGIQKAYVARNPKYYHYWFPLASPVNLYLNLTESPFNLLPFRQALAYAINRYKLYTQGEYGYEPPANQSLLPPALQSAGWLDKALAKQYSYPYDPAKAKHILAAAGFKLKGGQLYAPNGKPVAFTLEVPTGWTDWIEDCSIIQQELGQLGIKVTVETPSVTTDYNDVETGHFQAALVYGWNESNPYFIYYYILSSASSAPVGQVANFNSNTERWNNPLTNRLVAELAQTTNVARQHQIVDQLQQITFTQLPVIALMYGASWNEYQTNHWVGWPTASNPYADPSATWPDELLIITHLRPAH
jgi:peptide/nickel transport system substrate-binding protein